MARETSVSLLALNRRQEYGQDEWREGLERPKEFMSVGDERGRSEKESTACTSTHVESAV